MAEISYNMDPGWEDPTWEDSTWEASTNLDQVKNVKDSFSSSPQQIDPSQTKIINPKHSKQEPKTDYSGNPKEFSGQSNIFLGYPKGRNISIHRITN